MTDPNFRIEKLGDTNYQHWSVEMKNYLTVKGLWQVVKPYTLEELVDIHHDMTPGALPLTTEQRTAAVTAMAAATPIQNPFELASKDRMALAYMINSVRPEKKILIQDCATARAAWDLLENIHQAGIAARIVRLTSELVTFKKENNESLFKYANRYMEKRDLLLRAGGTFTDRDFKMRLLAGLGPLYYVAVETLSEWAMDDTKSINDLIARL